MENCDADCELFGSQKELHELIINPLSHYTCSINTLHTVHVIITKTATTCVRLGYLWGLVRL